MIAIFYSILWIAAAFKFGDRDWQKYYPTILYAALGNALYDLICYKYTLGRWNQMTTSINDTDFTAYLDWDAFIYLDSF